MPVYVYETILPDNSGGERFEMTQSMSEPALTTHPLTGEPVRRVIQAPNIASKYTPGQTRSRLDNKNVEKAGFTKYERDKVTGRYHKVAGKQGPSTLNPS